MFHRIKTTHGIALLGACLILAVVLINSANQGFGQFSTFSTLINLRNQTAAVSDFDNALVGHWTMDSSDINWSNGAITDASGNGDTGVFSNIIQSNLGIGQIGQALTFDGVGTSITAGAGSTVLPYIEPLSISAWVNIPTTPSSDGVIVSRWATYHDYYLELGGPNHDDPIFVGDSLSSGGSLWKADAGMDLTPGQWYHIVGTIDSSNDVDIYVNGNQVAGAYWNLGASPQFQPPITIGAMGDGTTYFRGVIDDVRIYNIALSADQVSQLYAAGTSGQPSLGVTSSSVTGITSTAATVIWSTSVAANSQVNYGTSVSYGQSTTLDSGMVISHSQSLTGLTPNTVYHYQISSHDGSGNVITSPDATFNTIVGSVTNTADIYISQNITGSGNASDCADSESVAWLATSGNWGGGAGHIGSGTTIHLCGTISTGINFLGSGTTGSPITLKFEPGAEMSAPVFPTAVNVNGQSYIVINGCTNSNGVCTAKDYSHNGTIENTDNGSADQYWTECQAFSSPCQKPKHFDNSQGSLAVNIGSGSNITVENLNISDIYVRAPGSDDPTGGFYASGGTTGINFSGGSNIVIYNNSITDAQTMIIGGMSVGQHDVTITSNDLLYFNWGIIVGSGEESGSPPTLDKLTISNNREDGFDAWENAVPPGTDLGFHRDCIYLFIDNPIHKDGWFRNVNIYGNYFGPGVNPQTSTAGTGAMFFSAYVADQFQNIRVYNNISTLKSPLGWSGGSILGGPLGTNVLVANNTVVDQGGGSGIGAGGKYLYIFNNISIDPKGEGIQTNDFVNDESHDIYEQYEFSDYNLYYGLSGAGNIFNTSWVATSTSGNYFGDNIADTLAEWQQWYSWDIHSITADPLLVSSNLSSPDFHLQASSPAIGAGKNLSDFDGTNLCTGWPQPSPSGDSGVPAPTLCSDYSGNPRPGPSSGEAWDLGAYQYCTSGCASDPAIVLPSPPPSSSVGGGSPSTDTTPPSVPTNLATTSVTSSSVALSWSASTDPTVSGQTTSGLAGYKIYRCQGSSCTPSTQIGSSVTSGTAYTDSSVSVSTAYTYAVSAYDNASPANESTKSSSVSVITPSVGTTYTLTYTANTHGSLTGTATQTVNSGANGSAVTAVPATGYSFTSWSDSSTTNPRTDTNVLGNISVSASFSPINQSVVSISSGPTTSSIDSSDATISWTTNLGASSQVLYGLTTAYGSQTTLDSSLVTSHSQSISGLLANTVYYYKVVSVDSNSNTASSSNTLTTAAAVTNSGGGYSGYGGTTGRTGGSSYTPPTPVISSIIHYTSRM